jgi:hypothetical protein
VTGSTFPSGVSANYIQARTPIVGRSEWAAELRIEFEMEGGAENQAETRLRTAMGELKRFIEGGATGVAKTNVSRGSAKAAIIKQGSTA